MSDLIRDVVDFHVKFGLNYDGEPRPLPQDMVDFRIGFLEEELEEYTDAMHHLYREDITAEQYYEYLEKAFDALLDLVYVAIGNMILHGFPAKEGWKRVQAANMAKVRAERPSESKRGSVYDVVKPEGWQPPDHSDLIRG